jgi:hypothetical protein
MMTPSRSSAAYISSASPPAVKRLIEAVTPQQ